MEESSGVLVVTVFLRHNYDPGHLLVEWGMLFPMYSGLALCWAGGLSKV